MLSKPAVPVTGAWAVFLDVDGTLIEIAATPDRVQVRSRVREVLQALAVRQQGALALVSGRGLADIDRLLAPLVLPTAGLHGAERRDAAGGLHRSVRGRALDGARARLAEFVRLHPGTLLEDKGAAIALHFRQAPDCASVARQAVQSEIQTLQGEFVLQEGKCVLEIKPAGVSKASAIEAFLEEPPFRTRRPLFIGDDVTDEDGFSVVRAQGGLAVAVGDRPGTNAQFGLPDVDAVLSWLEELAASPAGVLP